MGKTMKPRQTITHTILLCVTLPCLGCGSKKQELEISVGQPPLASTPERRSFDELRQQVGAWKPKLALPDAESAGKVGFAYHDALWRHPAKTRKVSVIDSGDEWLIIIDEVPPGSVGGDGYILLSKLDGSVLGAMHEE